MKERPILFSAPMVRAILAGTKTQTRRVMKPQPPTGHSYLLVDEIYPVVIDRHGDEQPGEEKYGVTTNDGEWCLPCPYGKPGDRLWVREAFAHVLDDKFGPVPDSIIYRADEGNSDWPHGWRPSIHMPRLASRILLEIVSVRVDRLQAISESDAKAEGAPEHCNFNSYDMSHLNGFCNLWHAINGPASWNSNPWVWVIEFKRIEVPA